MRIRHVEEVMGTVVSFDLRDVRDEPAARVALSASVDWLHHVDGVFSTYRPDSPISRLGRGEQVDLSNADKTDIEHVMRRCRELAEYTGGCFSAYPTGSLDPSGYVKGWSVDRAVDILRQAGCERVMVGAGGDVRVTAPASDIAATKWRVGIADPLDRGLLRGAIELAQGAVATSGTAERGAHVIDPRTREPASALVSLTVLGDDLATADALATACFVMGDDAEAWCEQRAIQSFAVRRDGTSWLTAGLEGLV